MDKQRPYETPDEDPAPVKESGAERVGSGDADGGSGSATRVQSRTIPRATRPRERCGI
jgi:hypothetical protein